MTESLALVPDTITFCWWQTVAKTHIKEVFKIIMIFVSINKKFESELIDSFEQKQIDTPADSFQTLQIYDKQSQIFQTNIHPWVSTSPIIINIIPILLIILFPLIPRKMFQPTLQRIILYLHVIVFLVTLYCSPDLPPEDHFWRKS